MQVQSTYLKTRVATQSSKIQKKHLDQISLKRLYPWHSQNPLLFSLKSLPYTLNNSRIAFRTEQGSLYVFDPERRITQRWKAPRISKLNDFGMKEPSELTIFAEPALVEDLDLASTITHDASANPVKQIVKIAVDIETNQFAICTYNFKNSSWTVRGGMRAYYTEPKKDLIPIELWGLQSFPNAPPSSFISQSYHNGNRIVLQSTL